MPVLLKKKISINRSEQRRMGGGSAQLQPLSEIEELAVALVGHDSRLVTTRGVAEPSLVSRQPDTVVSLQPSTPPAPSAAAAITSEEEEEEDEPISVEQEEEEANIFVGAEEPAAISIEMDEAPRPNGVQVATPRRDILHTPTPRRSGQRGEQSPTLNGQTECLISLCRETVMIGRDLIQGFEGFSTNWSQFSTNWSQFSTNWSQFNTNFSNWSSMQTEIARETLEAIREQTAATIALQHVLLAGHGTAPQGVVSARSEHSPSTRASTEDAVPPDSEVVPQVSASTLSPPPQQEVLPSHAAHCVRVGMRRLKRVGGVRTWGGKGPGGKRGRRCQASAGKAKMKPHANETFDVTVNENVNIHNESSCKAFINELLMQQLSSCVTATGYWSSGGG
uniref:uncharacterized protein n=1 Tax=Pristiophorus japonicus TaxID=55135 RepID=UPI00398F6BE2